MSELNIPESPSNPSKLSRFKQYTSNKFRSLKNTTRNLSLFRKKNNNSNYCVFTKTLFKQIKITISQCQNNSRITPERANYALVQFTDLNTKEPSTKVDIATVINQNYASYKGRLYILLNHLFADDMLGNPVLYTTSDYYIPKKYIRPALRLIDEMNRAVHITPSTEVSSNKKINKSTGRFPLKTNNSKAGSIFSRTKMTNPFKSMKFPTPTKPSFSFLKPIMPTAGDLILFGKYKIVPAGNTIKVYEKSKTKNSPDSEIELAKLPTPSLKYISNGGRLNNAGKTLELSKELRQFIRKYNRNAVLPEHAGKQDINLSELKHDIAALNKLYYWQPALKNKFQARFLTKKNNSGAATVPHLRK